MTSAINLSDARVQIDRAKHHYDDMYAVFSEWFNSRGVVIQAVADPLIFRFTWSVSVRALPSRNLPGLVGDIVNDLWSALDFTAFAVFRAAGGPAHGGSAGSVAFPILETAPADWDAAVQQKVPGAWPEAADALRASQPFEQQGIYVHALPTLRELSRTAKHRNLNMSAVAAMSAQANGPPHPNTAVQVRMFRAEGGDMQKGPLVPIEIGSEVAVASAILVPADAKHIDDALLRVNTIRWDEPSAPDVRFSFRANSGAEIDSAGLHELIEHVEGIVQRFAELTPPT